VILEPGELGDLIILQHGRRRMPLAYTHLLPATFGGKAMFNVQNAMAAAGAAYCAGEHLHDIRAGLRSFTPSYYSAPGRMNMTEVKGIKVIVDYCHNAPAMVALGDFVDRFFEDSAAWERPQRIGSSPPPAIAATKDMIDLGRESARHFDRIILREDVRFRGRVPGETAGLIVQGAKEAQAEVCRLKQIEVVLDEIEATRVGVEWANPVTWWWSAWTGPARCGTSCRPSDTGRRPGGRVTRTADVELAEPVRRRRARHWPRSRPARPGPGPRGTAVANRSRRRPSPWARRRPDMRAGPAW